MTTLHVLAPTYRPVGGVVKVLDYVNHARDAGCVVRIHCPVAYEPNAPIWGFDRFSELPDDPSVTFTDDLRVGLSGDDLVFLSWPEHHEEAWRGLARGMSPERIIHIVQGVRHANPTWLDGYPLRLLTRPMARITTNEVIQASIEPYLNPTSFCRIIPLGHPTGYFHKQRSSGLRRRVRVGYTTWKSETGDEVAERLEGQPFRFRAIRRHVDWPELRELYQWCDVFLGCPGPEEGFYMPAFEAMEAGAVVIVPDVGGNRAFCDFGRNCLRADLDDPDSYVSALHRVREMQPEEIDAMRAAGRAALEPFDLDSERQRFAVFLEQLLERIAVTERGGDDASELGRGPVDALVGAAMS